MVINNPVGNLNNPERNEDHHDNENNHNDLSMPDVFNNPGAIFLVKINLTGTPHSVSQDNKVYKFVCVNASMHNA